MEKRFTVRPVERRDRDDVISNYYGYQKEIKENVHFGTSSQVKLPTLKEEYEWFARLLKGIKENNTVASVAVMDERVVALCGANRESKVAEHMHIAELGIAVKKEARRIGIGKALLEDVITRSKDHFEILVLEVFASNKAQKLYKSVGFVEYGRLPEGLKRKDTYIDKVLMYLNLNKNKEK